MIHTPATVSRNCSLTLSLIVALMVLPASWLQAADSGMAGTYRCASRNVGGAGGRCTSPPLILDAHGTYHMSSEHGTYRVTGNRLYLSESRLRGTGLISGNQVIFEYPYQGLVQTVIYRREQQAAGSTLADARQFRGGDSSASVPVQLRIEFDRPDSWLAWVNTAKLAPVGTDSGDAITGIATATSRQSVRVSFRAVPVGRRYEVQLGSGTANYAVAVVDISHAKGPLDLTVSAQVPNKKQLR